MACTGNNDGHCCWLGGIPCPHLEENTVPDRHWACGLRRELGDWDLVLASDAYKSDVAPILEPKGINCRDYPEKLEGKWCATCGEGSH